MIVLPGPCPSSPPTTFFDRVSKTTEYVVGHPLAVAVAVVILIAWACTGPLFSFSDTWQLVINTATTIVTFLMVFLIQNTQNRSSAALHVKLDELIRSVGGAHNALVTLEDMTLQEIEQVRRHYERVARAARERLKQGVTDTDTPEVSLS